MSFHLCERMLPSLALEQKIHLSDKLVLFEQSRRSENYAAAANLYLQFRAVTQASGLKHMDQSVIHHPLEGLTQAARERYRSVVGRVRRILPGFWN
ncbi:hypothetical protein PoB_002106300 [Plakobranchus ocellatus]|uniref:Uncharacterized protein n=1 Tax=Plakobranchus ocellatus TaxID=259542 RepID=A0AAV3ZJ82_9GAST|nr:hypothetical protein PoB_002106300 [Plakobranchus ocellatus]